MKNKRASTLQYFQRTKKVSFYKYLHCRGKTKVSYYIILLEKQNGIILHHVLPNSWKRFSCGLCYDELKQQWTNCQTKYRTIFQVKEVSYGFCWNASSHANKMFLMVTQSLTNYLIFSSAWLPYGMPHCHGLYRSRRWSPSKSSVFEANLAYFRQHFRLRDWDSRYGL